MHESPDTTLEIAVPADVEKVRLDKFLAGKLPSVTRSKIQNLIKEDRVIIDGTASKANHLVRPEEIIRVFFPPPKITDILPEDIPLNIIYEDEYLLVVNKPAGMVVHPAYGNPTGTLVNALTFHTNKLSDVGGPTRPGLVHRLDKDTSGLLVVAKDDVTHVFLAKKLSERKMEREYRAIVWGHLRSRTGRVESALMRHPKDRLKIITHPDGKYAATNYEVLEELPLTSYLKLNLETGRTHQIRVHMSSLGHPIFSDAMYGGRGKQIAGLNHDRTKFANRLLKIFNRQMLHARTLSFIHPKSNKPVRFEAPIPPDMEDLLHRLKSSVGI